MKARNSGRDQNLKAVKKLKTEIVEELIRLKNEKVKQLKWKFDSHWIIWYTYVVDKKLRFFFWNQQDDSLKETQLNRTSLVAFLSLPSGAKQDLS